VLGEPVQFEISREDAASDERMWNMDLKVDERQELRRRILALISHFAAGGAASEHPDYARHVLCMLTFRMEDSDYGYAPEFGRPRGPRARRTPGP